MSKIILALPALTLLMLPSAAHAETISIGCTGGADTTICELAGSMFEERTGHTVNIVAVPNNATEMLALYQQLLSARSSDLDVLRIDGTWQGMLEPFMVDMASVVDGREDEWFPTIFQNNIVNGKMVSVPAFTDAGVLYYRQDLLDKHGREVPTTWQELTETAQFIQDAERAGGKTDIWGFVWQGRAYEGLTCDALEWVYSHGGGTIISPDGTVTINNAQAVKALELAASWVGTISPEGVLTYAEEEARGVFQNGNAVFMRNWPYAWTPAQADDSAIKGLVGVTILPAGEGGQSAATLGGWSYGVSEFSQNKDVATAFVEFITSAEFQLIRAVQFSNLPTMPAVYDEPELQERNSFIAGLQPVFLNAVSRPATVAGERYNAVSTEFFNTVHAVLSGDQQAGPALEALEQSIARALRGR
ncbi:MAG: ABC transporter substrate-binding protein [Pelagibacterium sp. SCN 64-44]|nr:MAG: ABC transporter substrate-binding protein [Pelagibacterium sp. SCN 64-44]